MSAVVEVVEGTQNDICLRLDEWLRRRNGSRRMLDLLREVAGRTAKGGNRGEVDAHGAAGSDGTALAFGFFALFVFPRSVVIPGKFEKTEVRARADVVEFRMPRGLHVALDDGLPGRGLRLFLKPEVARDGEQAQGVCGEEARLHHERAHLRDDGGRGVLDARGEDLAEQGERVHRRAGEGVADAQERVEGLAVLGDV